ncbi:MAG TPA: hypothetical protein VLG50_00200 [Candidatus Saccharimonadales bacterium]|nr:hypothetical protein [Candidatus Saccharimonadales bacterium]
MYITKENLIYICILSILFHPTDAKQYLEESYDENYCHNFKIRPYLFVPQSKLYRNIYGKVGGGIQLEQENSINNWLRVWVNVDGLFKRGHSIGLCRKTKIGAFTLSTGIKFLYEHCKRLQFALGVGPTIAGIFVRDQSLTCCKNSKCSGGIVAKTDLYGVVHDRLILDLFFDYTYQPVHFQRKVNVGGAKLGLGLGCTF